MSSFRASPSPLLHAAINPLKSFGDSTVNSVDDLTIVSRRRLVLSITAIVIIVAADLPTTTDAWQPCHPAPDFEFANGSEADFVGKLSADGRAVTYGSFVETGTILPNGGEGSAWTIFGVDAGGDLYLVGRESILPSIIRYRPMTRPKGSAACMVSGAYGHETTAAPLGLVRIRGHGISGGRTLSPAITGSSLPFDDHTPGQAGCRWPGQCKTRQASLHRDPHSGLASFHMPSRNEQRLISRGDTVGNDKVDLRNSGR